ncbi:hypothetical protein [Acetobacter malorum]|uniref:Uncharacterized protein n=1 Tax=Acetobacter malorum TaxID=178901 RepID=A0A1Y3GCQ2_9PROT|nr:hypothetical protein [Acetobacter malorum]OUJ06668.1 hypothetical protein HK23_14450 [Acetobacter malorum]
MTLAITVNNADYSGNSIGWEAPSTQQPNAAIFVTGGAIKNLAAGGSAPTSDVGTPVLTAGVSGQSLPFASLNNTAGINTGVAQTPAFTVISLLWVPTTDVGLCSLLSNHVSGASTFFAAGSRGGPVMNCFAWAASGQSNTINPGLTLGSWQIHGWQVDMSGTVLKNRYFNKTLSIDSSNNTTAITAQTVNGNVFKLGTDPTNPLTATHKMSSCLIWDSVLSESDITAVTNWLRQYALSFGTAV